jgi:hypothetical protein
MKKKDLLFAVLVIAGGCAKKVVTETALPVKEEKPIVELTSPAGDVVGKLTVGYQGWFAAAGDGSPYNSWQHQNLESWPECSEYTNSYAGSPFNQDGVVQPGYFGNLGQWPPGKNVFFLRSAGSQYPLLLDATERYRLYCPATLRQLHCSRQCKESAV